MNGLRQALVVAEWEFRRYFKWKDQLLGLVFILVAGLVWIGALAIAGAKGKVKTVAVVEGALALTSESDRPGSTGAASGDGSEADRRIELVPATASQSELAAQLAAGDVHGVLSRRGDGTFALEVAKDPRYRDELMALLTEVVRRERLAAAGLTAEALDAVLAPPVLEVLFTDPARGRRGKPEKVAAGVLIGLMVMAIFTSMAYLMTGIAGEKQLRVTEVVVSAIPARAWIDGKILGLTAYALTSMANLVISGLLLSWLAKQAVGFSLPAAAIRPWVLIVLVVFSLLGLLLWNAFFAAVAATLDDPNTSSRSSLMMLPVLPVVMSLALLRDPDSLLARILAVFPLTSAPAMPIRLVLSDPGLLEIFASLVLLIGAIWVFRRVAARIFEVGMLLYGKEPSFAEIRRWARGGDPVGDPAAEPPPVPR